MNTIINTIKYASFLTFTQIITLFSGLVIIGMILLFLEKLTNSCFSKTIGWKGVLLTGYIGTPIHELGHVIFCLIFRHKINEVKLFSPEQETGSLGYVKHSYNPKSYYQRIGNFFIGIGPLITGSILLAFLISNFVAGGKDLLDNFTNGMNVIFEKNDFIELLGSFYFLIKRFILSLFSDSNIHKFSFWIFLYFSLSIASHMTPSMQDLKNSSRGFFLLIIILFLINILGSILGFSLGKIIYFLNIYSGILVSLLVFSAIMSLLNFFISFFILNIYSKIIKGKFFLPL